MKNILSARYVIRTFLLLLSFDTTAQVTRQPYLQIPTPNSMVVRWQTGTGEIGKINSGTSVSSLTQNINESEDEGIYHEVNITGLKSNTKYFYSVEGPSKGTEDQYFITAPYEKASVPVRIWVISDFGQTNSSDNKRRLETVAQWKSFNNNSYHASFVLSLGDQTEDDATYQIQHNYFNQLQNVLKTSPLYPTIGNHDNHDSLYNYLKTFTLPSEADAGGTASNTEKYYSFDYSDIHVVVLCTEIYDDTNFKAQTEWLKNDLVLQGHNHVYERSFLIDNLIGKSTTATAANKINIGPGRSDKDGFYQKPLGSQPHKGTIFISVPGGGVANSAKYYHAPFSIYPVVFPGSDYEGSLVIDVNDNKMDVKFLCDEKNEKGVNIWDYFSIIKNN